jgi:hypothetical protein
METYGYAVLFSLTGYLGLNIVLTLVKSFGALVAVTSLNLNFLFKLRSSGPCAVIAGPLPPNVNTVQNAVMKLIKLKVSSQTVTLQ